MSIFSSFIFIITFFLLSNDCQTNLYLLRVLYSDSVRMVYINEKFLRNVRDLPVAGGVRDEVVGSIFQQVPVVSYIFFRAKSAPTTVRLIKCVQSKKKSTEIT